VGLLDSERLAFLKKLRPASVKRLASLRMEDVVGLEAKRARVRVKVLRTRYPSAGPRELGHHVIESTKGLASLSGSVSGVFGMVSVPADLVVMAWLQIRMLDDIATAYGVDLRFRRARTELLDVLGEATGVGPLKRSGPRVLSKVAAVIAEKGGFVTIGRAMPLVAAPVTAWLNNHHIQMVGEAALRHYDGFVRAAAKTRAASGANAP
jgi:uncharacterized protein (DUF697 family)